MSTTEHYLIKDFKRLIESGSLGHAYLLFGEGSERVELGKQLLNYLEFNALDGNSAFFDGKLVLKRESGVIGIDEVRDVINFLWQKPLRSARKTVFINEAQTLTLEAQNALLKITENPPEHGLVILSVSDPALLIPPLASRFQKIYLNGYEEHFEADQKLLALAVKFIKSNSLIRKNIIRDLLEEENEIPNFIKALLIECRKDPIKNFELMRRVIDRWAKISQFNTNVKLQLETLIN